jgi:hypothetical protein
MGPWYGASFTAATVITLHQGSAMPSVPAQYPMVQAIDYSDGALCYNEYHPHAPEKDTLDRVTDNSAKTIVSSGVVYPSYVALTADALLQASGSAQFATDAMLL